ncbi:hypothetical protein AOLI_G00008580 [Acnodon oligacanthus]
MKQARTESLQRGRAVGDSHIALCVPAVDSDARALTASVTGRSLAPSSGGSQSTSRPPKTAAQRRAQTALTGGAGRSISPHQPWRRETPASFMEHSLTENSGNPQCLQYWPPACTDLCSVN